MLIGQLCLQEPLEGREGGSRSDRPLEVTPPLGRRKERLLCLNGPDEKSAADEGEMASIKAEGAEPAATL